MPEGLAKGVLRFPGIQQVKKWTFTVSHGISPAIAVMEIAPQDEDPPTDPQTMTIEFGEDVFLEFPFCIIDQATVEKSHGTIVRLSIKDRRWAWKYGDPIVGRYNVRKKDGTLITDTQKNPQELATLLLEAMDEEDYDVSALTTQSNPAVDWQYANPASELQSLVESLGCRIVLDDENNVKIVVAGNGADLPEGAVRTLSFGVDPPEKPDSMIFVGGETRYQSCFTTEAVGLDVDPNDDRLPGPIKKINDLSYKPEGGWGVECYAGFYNVGDPSDPNDITRELALRSVYKWYRIVATSPSVTYGKFNIQGYEGTQPTQRWQVLPLEDSMVTIYLDSDNIERPVPAYVFGQWHEENPAFPNLSGNKPWKKGFSINREKGIIELSECAAQFTPGAGGTQTVIPANIFIMVGHCVKDRKNFSIDRWTTEQDVPGEDLGVGQQILHRPDVIRTVVGNYDGNNFPNPTGTEDNEDEITKEANYYFAATLAQFQILATAHAEYAGIVEASLDGAIQQIQWSGGTDGGATTQISRNNEHHLAVPKYSERRIREHVHDQHRGFVRTADGMRHIIFKNGLDPGRGL